jgi:large subunit ribosomal protein L21
MYAVVEIGGHQYKVAEEDVIFVDRQSEEKDGEVSFDRVMLINDGDNTTVGTPVVEGAEVKAKVLDHLKDDKVMVFKKKRRKGYRVKRGHRQQLTQLKIEKISA